MNFMPTVCCGQCLFTHFFEGGVVFYGWKESGMLMLNLCRALRQSVYHLVSFHVGFCVCLWGDDGHPKKHTESIQGDLNQRR